MKKLLIGGSPCTHWSVAQTKDRETKAEGLGWELFVNFLIAKEKFQPDFFLYENNKSAAPAIKEQIGAELGYPLQYIDSALFSAQTRQRFYVHNFGEVALPETSAITVADILETGVPYKDGKGYALDPRYYTGKERDSFIRSSETIRVGTVKNTKDKISVTQSSRVFSPNGKSCTQCAGGGGMGAKTGLYLCPVTEDENVSPKYRVKSGLVQIEGITVNIPVVDGLYAIRKLTVTEATRLQTLPDDYCLKGLDVQFKSIFTDNSKLTEVILCESNVELTGVRLPLQAEKLDCATSIILDLNAMEQLKNQETMLTSQKNVLLKVAVDTKTQTMVTALCTTKDIKDTEQQSYLHELLKNVTIVIAKRLHEECVDVTIRIGKHTETLYMPMSKEFCVMNVDTKAMIIDELLKRCSIENCSREKLYTILTLIQQITMKLISMCVETKMNTLHCTCSSIKLQGNLLNWELSDLKMGYIKAISNSAVYHGLGNGWTAEVIIHLLRKGLADVDRDEELQVLSMYDGIGTGRYCLEQLGFTNITYWAYEIEPSAIQIAKSNYSDIIECGDAFALRKDGWGF